MRHVHEILGRCRSVVLAFAVASLTLAGCSADAGQQPVPADLDEYDTAVTADYPVGTILRTTTALNLRQNPSTSAAVLDVMAGGDEVTLLQSSPSNGFYNVNHQGQVGWASGKYLEVVQVGGNDAGAAGSGGGQPLPPVMTFKLNHAAYPGSGHPDVAVHIPNGFDPSDHPSLVAYFHGFWNCVTVAMGSVNGPCINGGQDREALHLVDQFDAAKVNGILVAVELKPDLATGAPGKLANSGEFKAMLHELLVAYLSPKLGTQLDVANLDRVILASHSGGYQAVAKVLDVGKVDIDEVQLFDSLYGSEASYWSWINGHLSEFASARRFANVWTTSGGTASNSVAQKSKISSALQQAGSSQLLFYDNATSTSVGPGDYAHPFFFKHSGLGHFDVPRHYFQPLLVASGMAPLK
ncbi:MAG: SH3 domain-containing protein [Deltaproteobacteria bacterium]|nr:SH3 domain-containing protein [Deltaproteobacteria bacterium]